jgi:hypothetical protein
MPQKIKERPAGEKASHPIVEPVRSHEVTNQAASANAASRSRATPNQPASGAANHARHHESRKTQA